VNDPDQSKKLLHTYLRRLTNLSGNNRSIFLPRLVGDQFLDLQQLSQLNGEKAFTIIEALIAEKFKTICPVLDARMEASNEVSTKLKKLKRLDQFIFDERGSKDLHVGWPFVQGKFNDGTLVRCPLLFFPVTLTIIGNQWVLQPRKDAGITFNKSFLLAYSFFNKVKANEVLLEETFEDADRESTVFRTWLYQLLKTSELELNFNPDNYQNELAPFENYKREELEEASKTGALKLFPHAVLGIFPQAGSYLVPDYMHLIEESATHDLEEFFHQRTVALEIPESQNFHALVKEEKMFTVFPQDIWQENALKAAKLGHSLVVQGPPGTGKSQLICNLISDAMASGKRVLVVCQKRAALDVVYNRMKTHQLSEYLALVHDFKNDRKDIYAKIADQIEKVDSYRLRNISLDAIQMERQFTRASHRIDAIIDELATFKESLFDETECGVSIKELYLQSNTAQEVISLKQEFAQFRLDDLSPFLRKLKTYLHHAVTLKAQDYAWKERKSFSSFSAGDLSSIIKAVEEVKKLFILLTDQLQSNLNTNLDWEQCEVLLDKEPLAHDIKALLTSDKVYSYFQKMVPEQDEETSALWLSNLEKNLMTCFEGDGPEIHTPASQLGALQKALYRTMKARKSLVGLIRWELFSKDKFLIKRTLVANGLASTKDGFKTLEKKLDSRLNLEHNLSKIRDRSWLHEMPETLFQKDYILWFADQHFALNAKLNFSELRWIKTFIDPASHTLKEFVHKIDQLYTILNQIHEYKVRWANYLTPIQINYITQFPDEVPHLVRTVKQDFDALCEFDALSENLTADEKSIISRLNDHTQSWEAEKITPLFINSLSMAWIDHLEAKHPELRMVSSGKISMLENELRDLHREKQNISEEIVLLRAREKVVDELKFNRLNNRVTYRDLHHQVTKKKKIWPIRKLIAEFEEEVFKLVPCWLASPESVSAIFPMSDLFDLVIFDEASQCFAERGIPSLYRGKQTIIAGDAMQLRPGDFYQSRWQDEDDDHPDTEVDSLLELAGRYLMNTQLRGHYRSKSPELIHFSNQHFYKGNLQFLPDLHTLNQPEPAMMYEKIDGVWENNTNLLEAIHVANKVLTLTQENPTVELGIVTFNAPQQALVLDMLEETFREAGQLIPESLFVKNIENVQGDERDIIIFSVGYAPDKKGKVNAQFGSLNLAGGENRLNVAVSRAREKIIVVTSLWPDQLNVADTINAGPKLLKSYLQFVLDTSQGKHAEVVSIMTQKKSTSSLKEEIKKWALLKWPAYQLEESRLPYIDFTVKKEERKVGALFTDDNLYFQSPSVKADHALTPQLLELKNWPFVRVYSRNFWQDPDKFFNEVSKLLNQ
jgi:DNA polymerase IIIc chi subunit